MKLKADLLSNPCQQGFLKYGNVGASNVPITLNGGKNYGG